MDDMDKREMKKEKRTQRAKQLARSYPTQFGYYEVTKGECPSCHMGALCYDELNDVIKCSYCRKKWGANKK